MIRVLLSIAAACLLTAVLGCGGDPPNANPKVSSDSKPDPRLQPAGQNPAGAGTPAGAPAGGTAKPAGALNQP